MTDKVQGFFAYETHFSSKVLSWRTGTFFFSFFFFFEGRGRGVLMKRRIARRMEPTVTSVPEINSSDQLQFKLLYMVKVCDDLITLFSVFKSSIRRDLSRFESQTRALRMTCECLPYSNRLSRNVSDLCQFLSSTIWQKLLIRPSWFLKP